MADLLNRDDYTDAAPQGTTVRPIKDSVLPSGVLREAAADARYRRSSADVPIADVSGLGAKHTALDAEDARLDARIDALAGLGGVSGQPYLRVPIAVGETRDLDVVDHLGAANNEGSNDALRITALSQQARQDQTQAENPVATRQVGDVNGTSTANRTLRLIGQPYITETDQDPQEYDGRVVLTISNGEGDTLQMTVVVVPTEVSSGLTEVKRTDMEETFGAEIQQAIEVSGAVYVNVPYDSQFTPRPAWIPPGVLAKWLWGGIPKTFPAIPFFAIEHDEWGTYERQPLVTPEEHETPYTTPRERDERLTEGGLGPNGIPNVEGQSERVSARTPTDTGLVMVAGFEDPVSRVRDRALDGYTDATGNVWSVAGDDGAGSLQIRGNRVRSNNNNTQFRAGFGEIDNFAGKLLPPGSRVRITTESWTVESGDRAWGIGAFEDLDNFVILYWRDGVRDFKLFEYTDGSGSGVAGSNLALTLAGQPLASGVSLDGYEAPLTLTIERLSATAVRLQVTFGPFVSAMVTVSDHAALLAHLDNATGFGAAMAGPNASLPNLEVRYSATT